MDFLPTMLNTVTTSVIFQESGKQDSLGHVLKSSANMYECLCSQSFRTITGIQLRAGGFEKSSL